MFPQVFGKFVLERELSSGGMARVFVATLRGAVGFRKRLVVKQIRPELASDVRFVERFVEEAKTSVELAHPNIVPVYELGVEAGVYYIAMELCPGVTLAELLLAEGALEPEEGAYIGVELARALGYAHRRASIVHRDVTPRNVLIDDEGAVRLIDFGIAAPVASDESADREVFGTPGHMPPEQIRGDRLTPATDVFALAALLLETWTGSAPFRRATQEESLRAVWGPPPPFATRVPRLAALEPFVSMCLATEPSARPQAIDELGRALRDFLREADAGDLARAVGQRVRRVRRASRASAAGSQPDQVPGAGRSSRTASLADERRSTTRLGEAQLSRTFATRPLPAATDLDELLAASEEEGGAGDRIDSTAVTRKLTARAEESARSVEEPVRSEPSAPAPRRRAWAIGLGATAAAVLVALSLGRAPEKPEELRGGVVAAQGKTPNDEASRGSSSKSVSAPGTAASESGAHTPIEPPSSASAPTPSILGPAHSAEVDRAATSHTSATAPAKAPAAPADPSKDAPGKTAVESPTSASTAQVGMVSLTSAPSAQVNIAGRTLSTPVRQLQLPAGSYRVTFKSPTWDGGISADVQVSQDKPRSVHADFTSEPPRVVVR